ncbi:hypothetical protein ACFFX0_09350 [Citricoccus parietis]|uniref:Uncharacterized protein n=1 Tax=Citricoccus parietis TaxID=592307 RepID=A0ABV5FXI2_9MICC
MTGWPGSRPCRTGRTPTSRTRPRRRNPACRRPRGRSSRTFRPACRPTSRAPARSAPWSSTTSTAPW